MHLTSPTFLLHQRQGGGVIDLKASPCLVDVLYSPYFCFYCGVSTSTLQSMGKTVGLDVVAWRTF
jgi:hypothetical protein